MSTDFIQRIFTERPGDETHTAHRHEDMIMAIADMIEFAHNYTDPRDACRLRSFTLECEMSGRFLCMELWHNPGDSDVSTHVSTHALDTRDADTHDFMEAAAKIYEKAQSHHIRRVLSR